jgi:hypothetical protein
MLTRCIDKLESQESEHAAPKAYLYSPVAQIAVGLFIGLTVQPSDATVRSSNARIASYCTRVAAR